MKNLRELLETDLGKKADKDIQELLPLENQIKEYEKKIEELRTKIKQIRSRR
jgi:TolA-binding protein